MVDTTSRALRIRAMEERGRRRRRRLLVSLTVALALIMVVGSMGYARWRFGQIASVEVPGLHAAGNGEPFNILVVGSDTRSGANSRYGNVAGQRNDVTMVVRVDPGRRTVSMISIPRDLLVPIAETGRTDKINAAFTGGPSRVAKTIEQDFGIPIHHYVLIDFNGFKRIVDALGGIKVSFPYPSRDMDDHGRNMSGLSIRRAGCQLLNGTQALALARSRDFSYVRDGVRRWDPNGDLGRIRRQQAFLQGVLKKGLATGLTNPIRANAFIGAIVHDLTKDKGLDIGDAVRLGTRFRSFSPSDLETFTIPTQPLMEGTIYRGEVVKQPAAQQVVAKFLGLPDPTTSQSSGSAPPPAATTATLVHIRNAIGVQGLAARTRDQLRQAGFRVADVGNAGVAGVAVTRIAYPPGELAKAQALRAAVLGRAELREDPGLPTGEVTLMIGSNFRGVQAVASATSAPNSTTTSTRPPGSGATPGAPGGTPGAKKPPASKPTLELRDYDPRPC